MKKLICFLLTLVLTLCLSVSAFAATPELKISKSNIKGEVPDTLYGAFIEDISYACDGGLVSNLVNNGSFEYEPNREAGWVFDAEQVEFGEDKPLNENNKSYALLTVSEEGTAENLGFPELFDYKTYDPDEDKASTPDMGFKEGALYDFSCYIKNVSFEGNISVCLTSKENKKDYIQLDTQGVGAAGWTQVSTVIKSSETADGGLMLTFTGSGTIAIDFVSLIPHDSYGYGSVQWQNTTLRTDFVEALQNLKPGFIRFPGGCFIEGTDVNKLYSWKDTIGALPERKQSTNIWADDNISRYYNNTNAMGYHEFFQLCEDLGAKAVPVVTAGMMCQGRSGYDDHLVALKRAEMSEEEWRSYLINERGYDEKDEEGMDGFTDWIDSLEINSQQDFENYLDTIALRPGTDEFKNYTQDVLDLIEYANGNAQTSYWGALRSANGHPDPYNIEYLEIGNENWGDLYFRNLKPLYRAVKQSYPDIKIIVSAGSYVENFRAWEVVNKEYKDCLVDEHYYTGDNYLFEHNDRYDSYDRSGAGVMLGEYSAKAAGFGTMITKNNLYSAVEEASFLTGIERNSDIVKMACYAPTFAKVNANAWDLNMIWFDSHNIALTPDYFAHMLFANNTGSQLIETSLDTGDENKLYHSVTVDEKTQSVYIKLVARDEGRKIKISLDGFDKINYASNISISHTFKEASNEIGKQRIVPIDEALEFKGNSLEVELKKNSVNVIRIAYGENNGSLLYHLPDNIDYATKSFVPAKVIVAIAVIFVALIAGTFIGLLLYTKLLRKKK